MRGERKKQTDAFKVFALPHSQRNKCIILTALRTATKQKNYNFIIYHHSSAASYNLHLHLNRLILLSKSLAVNSNGAIHQKTAHLMVHRRSNLDVAQGKTLIMPKLVFRTEFSIKLNIIGSCGCGCSWRRARSSDKWYKFKSLFHIGADMHSAHGGVFARHQHAKPNGQTHVPRR